MQAVFAEFQARVELHFASKGYKIQELRVGDGTEYIESMQKHLLQGRITCDTTMHYCPESNGVTARLTSVIFDMGHNMLFGS